MAWLREYHRRCRPGLTGPAGEATWAVTVDHTVVGSVRLKNTGDAGVLETGIWLTREARGRGIGRMALHAVLEEAVRPGAQEVRADTTANNSAALNLLSALDFTGVEDGGRINARLRLDSESSPGAAKGP